MLGVWTIAIAMDAVTAYLIAGAVVMAWTGWYRADALISAGIGLVVLWGTGGECGKLSACSSKERLRGSTAARLGDDPRRGWGGSGPQGIRFHKGLRKELCHCTWRNPAT